MSFGAGEFSGLVATNEAVAAGAENFAYAADVGGDDRLARGNGFEHDIGQGFRAARHDQNLSEFERLTRGHAAGEPDVVGISDCPGVFFEHFPVGTGADEHQGRASANARLDQRQQFRRRRVLLDRRRRADAYAGEQQFLDGLMQVHGRQPVIS